MALDDDLAGPGDGADQRAAILEPARQHGMPAVDEALGQPVMQGIRQAILDRPAALLPMDRIVEPGGAMGDEGPGADMGDAADQRIDVALDAVEPGDLGRHPVGRQASAGARWRKI